MVRREARLKFAQAEVQWVKKWAIVIPWSTSETHSIIATWPKL